MNVLVIGASSEAIFIIKKVKELGYRIIAIDGNENAPAFKYVDRKIVVDIFNLEEINIQLKNEKIDFIIPIPIGRGLTTIGFFNSKYNLKGITYEASINCTDKYKFHKILKKVNLRNINSYLIKPNEEAKEYILNYPAILKPRYGSGSKGILYLNDKDDLIKILKNKRNEDYILEELVQGVEYGIDGSIINGELEIILLREKENTPFPFFQAIGYYSINDQTLIKKVEDKLLKILSSLKVDNSLFHADIIINSEDIFIIELSGRPSGHNLSNCFTPLATGVDILENYFNFLLGKKYSFRPKKIKTMLLKFIDFENCIVKEIPTEEKILKLEQINIIKYKSNLYKGQSLKKIIDGKSIMERGFFIIEGKDKKDLKRQSKIVLSQFELKGEK